jgi:hypothetical protein
MIKLALMLKIAVNLMDKFTIYLKVLFMARYIKIIFYVLTFSCLVVDVNSTMYAQIDENNQCNVDSVSIDLTSANGAITAKATEIDGCETILEITNTRNYWVNLSLSPIPISEVTILPVGGNLNLYHALKVLSPNGTVRYQVKFSTTGQIVIIKLDWTLVSGEMAKNLNLLQGLYDAITIHPSFGSIKFVQVLELVDLEENYSKIINALSPQTVPHLSAAADAMFSFPPNLSTFTDNMKQANENGEVTLVLQTLADLGFDTAKDIIKKHANDPDIPLSPLNVGYMLGIIETMWRNWDAVFSLWFEAPAGFVILSAESDTPVDLMLEIKLGDELNGTLGSKQSRFYSFAGLANEEVVINLDTNYGNLDPYLRLSNEVGEMIAENDDKDASTLNSEIAISLPYSGKYLLQVSSLINSGEYRLTLQGGQPSDTVVELPPNFPQEIFQTIEDYVSENSAMHYSRGNTFDSAWTIYSAQQATYLDNGYYTLRVNEAWCVVIMPPFTFTVTEYIDAMPELKQKYEENFLMIRRGLKWYALSETYEPIEDRMEDVFLTAGCTNYIPDEETEVLQSRFIPTPTSTFTPTITDTPSNTPTITFTPTASYTPTITLTPTATYTPTITLTPTSTYTPTTGPTPTYTLPPTAENSQIEVVEVIDLGNVETEALVIRNSGRNVNIKGWTVSDLDGNIYTFGDRNLFSNGEITLRTGKGDSTPAITYWNLTSAVWEEEDIVFLKDSAGIVQAVAHITTLQSTP